jgi:uncharacterized membrane protein YfcA
MRNVAEIIGTALLMIVFLGTVPLLGILGIWHWTLTLALLIGVPLWAVWGSDLSRTVARRRLHRRLYGPSRRT